MWALRHVLEAAETRKPWLSRRYPGPDSVNLQAFPPCRQLLLRPENRGVPGSNPVSPSGNAEDDHPVLAAHRPKSGHQERSGRGQNQGASWFPGQYGHPGRCRALNKLPVVADDLIGATLSATARWMASLSAAAVGARREQIPRVRSIRLTERAWCALPRGRRLGSGGLRRSASRCAASTRRQLPVIAAGQIGGQRVGCGSSRQLHRGRVSR